MQLGVILVTHLHISSMLRCGSLETTLSMEACIAVRLHPNAVSYTAGFGAGSTKELFMHLD